MRKTFIITLILFILFIATGFEKLIGGRTEIENIFFITTVGIDKAEEDNIKLTIISKKFTTGNNQGSQEENKYYSIEGRTIFEGNRKFRSFMDKEIFWGHTDVILISEELAKTNITSYLDFFIRDHENRLTSSPVIIKGYTAEELIKTVTEEDEDITDKISAMLQDAPAISISSDVKLVEALCCFDNKYTSTYIPCIRIEEEKKEKARGEEENQENQQDQGNERKQETKKKVILDGYAIFDQDTLNLIGFIHDKRARGLNWVKNIITSGIIVVKDPDEEKITLEIIESKTKIIPEYKDGEWKVTIQVKMSSNLGEQQGTANVYNKEGIQNLNKQQQQIITNEIKDVINYAKENNIDLFDISGVINRKFPVKWEKEIKNNWRAIFQDITFDVEVDSKINRVYVIREPIKSKDGE